MKFFDHLFDIYEDDYYGVSGLNAGTPCFYR